VSPRSLVARKSDLKESVSSSFAVSRSSLSSLDSPLWKHAKMIHVGAEAVSFSMKVNTSFRDPLTRQINEALRISNCSATTQLNSRTEWHGPATVCLVAEGEVGLDLGF
jgi:hypothetical protein